MPKKLYVGNLSFKATEDDIREMFAQIGEVSSVKLITDRDTGRLKGFGFVEMVNDDEAMKAIETLNGKTLMDRQITVNEARPQQPRPSGGGGGRRFGGGEGRSGGGRGRGDMGGGRY